MNNDTIQKTENNEAFEKEWYNEISNLERELDKKIMPLLSEEKQEEVNKVYETICEIQKLDERTNALQSYVNELKRVYILEN